MCSNGSGDYENPDMTQPDDGEVVALPALPEIPLGPMTTTEARAIAHEFAKVRERKAYALVLQAEENLRNANNHWEECCTDMYATQPEN